MKNQIIISLYWGYMIIYAHICNPIISFSPEYEFRVHARCIGLLLCVPYTGHFFVLSVIEGCDPVNRLYYAPAGPVCGILSFTKASTCVWSPLSFHVCIIFTSLFLLKQVVDNFDAQYEVIANDGTVYVTTARCILSCSSSLKANDSYHRRSFQLYSQDQSPRPALLHHSGWFCPAAGASQKK